VWDERTPRGRFHGCLVKQISRIAVIVVVMFLVCAVCVTLCCIYVTFLGSDVTDVCELYFVCRLRPLSLVSPPLAAASS
jgi:hypothetical protein